MCLVCILLNVHVSRLILYTGTIFKDVDGGVNDKNKDKEYIGRRNVLITFVLLQEQSFTEHLHSYDFVDKY